ncbi:hypothetical protein H0H81_001046, partial [Sphagnurus paluster]
YSSNGKVTNTCTFDVSPVLLFKCSTRSQSAFTQGIDGRIVSNTSNSPSCPDAATLATDCERSRQERLRIDAENIAAAKKAAFIKSTYTDKGAIAVDCAEFLSEKAGIRKDYVPPASFYGPPSQPELSDSPDTLFALYSSLAGSRTNRIELQARCNDPRRFATTDSAKSTASGGKYKEFVDDMKAMVKTEYGTLFVTSAEDKMKLEEALKACQKRLYEQDKSVNGTSYNAPTNAQVDIDFVRLPVLPQECLGVDDPSYTGGLLTNVIETIKDI